MKVIDIIKKINDVKQFIEIKYTAEDGGGSFGIYNKNELIYNNLKNRTIKNIYTQYIDNKRLLVLEVK